MFEKRKLIFYDDYFWIFYNTLTEKVKDKIDQVLYLVAVAERIPVKFFKKIVDCPNLYELRIEYQSNIYRVFCCFDDENVVILFNGFQKKTQKTPTQELQKAIKIKETYFSEKAKYTI